MDKHSPRFLSIPQTAEMLGVHRGTIYRAIEDGRIPAVQLGGRGKPLRVPEDELLRWIYTPGQETR